MTGTRYRRVIRHAYQKENGEKGGERKMDGWVDGWIGGWKRRRSGRVASIVIQIVSNYSPAPLEPALVPHAHDAAPKWCVGCMNALLLQRRRDAARIAYFLVANKFIANINLPRFTDRFASSSRER